MEIRVSVYDISGREIAFLQDGLLEAGQYISCVGMRLYSHRVRTLSSYEQPERFKPTKRFYEISLVID